MRLASTMGFYKGARVQSPAATLLVDLKNWNTCNWHSRGGLIEPHKFLTRSIFCELIWSYKSKFPVNLVLQE